VLVAHPFPVLLRLAAFEQENGQRVAVLAHGIGDDALVEDTITIADEPAPSTAAGNIDTGAVQHAKLRIETRRWYAERLAARKYGALQKLEHSGPGGGAIKTLVVATGVPDGTVDINDLV
jgi:hypothetical protein